MEQNLRNKIKLFKCAFTHFYPCLLLLVGRASGVWTIIADKLSLQKTNFMDNL